MSASETPRTDAAYERVINGDCLPGCDSHGHEEMCPRCNPERVLAEDMRQLERELTARREADEGYVRVPREPTESMLLRGFHAFRDTPDMIDPEREGGWMTTDFDAALRNAYKAMLTAPSGDGGKG